jgi:hypothetical protein
MAGSSFAISACARLPERWRELMQSIHLIESNTGKVQ